MSGGSVSLSWTIRKIIKNVNLVLVTMKSTLLNCREVTVMRKEHEKLVEITMLSMPTVSLLIH